MNGIPTRNFQNIHYRTIKTHDFLGSRVILDHHYKLVINGATDSDTELFHLGDDPAETHNLAADEPAIVITLAKQLREWQSSTLNSLTGADYR
jgi:arylsulfatase A-like enzyme